MCLRAFLIPAQQWFSGASIPLDRWCSTLHKWETITGVVGFNPRRRRVPGRGDGGERERSRSPWEQQGGRRQEQTHRGFLMEHKHDYVPSVGFSASLYYRHCQGITDSNSWLFRGSVEFADSICPCNVSWEQTDESETIPSVCAVVPILSSAKNRRAPGSTHYASDLTRVVLGQQWWKVYTSECVLQKVLCKCY